MLRYEAHKTVRNEEMLRNDEGVYYLVAGLNLHPRNYSGPVAPYGVLTLPDSETDNEIDTRRSSCVNARGTPLAA